MIYLGSPPVLLCSKVRAVLLRMIAVFGLITAFSPAAAVSDTYSFDQLIAESEYQAGFLPLYWHGGEAKLFAEVNKFDQPFIYYPSLSQGVGSNDLGLDRGRLGETQLVQFEREGPRVLLVALNTRYRATSDNPAETRAVNEAFARSVLWGFDVVAEKGLPNSDDTGVLSVSPNITLTNSLLSSIDSNTVTTDEIREAFCRDVDTFSWELGQPDTYIYYGENYENDQREYEIFENIEQYWSYIVVPALIIAVICKCFLWPCIACIRNRRRRSNNSEGGQQTEENIQLNHS